MGVPQALPAEHEGHAVPGHGGAQLHLRVLQPPVRAQPGDAAPGPALAVAVVEYPQLDLDGRAVRAHLLADHLGPEAPHAAEDEPGPGRRAGPRRRRSRPARWRAPGWGWASAARPGCAAWAGPSTGCSHAHRPCRRPAPCPQRGQTRTFTPADGSTRYAAAHGQTAGRRPFPGRGPGRDRLLTRPDPAQVRLVPQGRQRRRVPPALLRHPVPHRRGRRHLLLPPCEEQAGLWVDRTLPDFVFNIKAFSLLTGHPTRRKAPPEDLLDEVALEHRDKERFYASHLSADGQAEVWRRFRDALLPLDLAGKLGAVLLQYPEWFTPRRSSREELQAVRDRLGGYQVCVEFRNAAWLATDRDRDRTLGLLRDHDLSPGLRRHAPGLPLLGPPIADATSPALSVVRFHGRDPEAWKKKTVGERFRYLYTEKEPAEWVPKIGHLADTGREVHILMNNCFRDQAVTNARQLADPAEQGGRAGGGCAHP